MGIRTVVVTGASSGLGRALSLQLAARGASVAVVARRKDELDAVAREIGRGGGRALVIAADLSDAAAAAEAVRRARAELGDLDAVVANAGVGYFGDATTMTWEEMARIIDVNVRGTMAAIHAAVQIFLERRGGHVVGVTSLAGQRGLPHSGAYGASKAAISTFLETLRYDLAHAGIRVTDVQPGYIDTAMTQAMPKRLFMWTAERSAEHIVRRLDAAPPVIAFPLPAVASTRVLRHAPSWVFAPVTRISTGVKKRKPAGA